MALLTGGGYAEKSLVDERHAMPIPGAFTFDQAAAVPVAWLTAHHLLSALGQIKAGQFVLVHASASNVRRTLRRPPHRV